MEVKELIEKYFDAFNKHDQDGMLVLMATDIVHDINEGPTEIGVDLFKAFLKKMSVHYKESIRELNIMINGNCGAAEFLCDGTYLKTDPGLPEANGQTYSIPGIAVFEERGGKISRITSYYNLRSWKRMVGGQR